MVGRSPAKHLFSSLVIQAVLMDIIALYDHVANATLELVYELAIIELMR